jgi:hypothetical protein
MLTTSTSPQSSPTNVTLEEVLSFQREVINPYLEVSRLPIKLAISNWMGLENGGLTLADMPADQAQNLIDLIGPSAFKVVRFSRNLLATLQAAKEAGRPIITSGGSCLLTSADKGNWKANPLADNELQAQIKNLPNLMQIFDASLPIHCADDYVNIIEDSLFVELGHECSTPALGLDELKELFKNEGQRHSEYFQELLWLFGTETNVLPTFFGKLPIAKASQSFWESDEVFNKMRNASLPLFDPAFAGQLQVMFSFTGGWADMLREVGHIPEDSCYLIVEPFHHFTEAADRDQHTKLRSKRWKLYEGFDNLMTRHPYGKDGPNSGVQGAVAFLPALAIKGMLGHTNLQLADCCSKEQAQLYLEQRQAELSFSRIPSPHDNVLFTESLNFLFHVPSCRASLRLLMNQTLGFRKEAEHLKNKKERKAFIKEKKIDRANLRTATEHYTLLYDELSKLVHSFFG